MVGVRKLQAEDALRFSFLTDLCQTTNLQTVPTQGEIGRYIKRKIDIWKDRNIKRE